MFCSLQNILMKLMEIVLWNPADVIDDSLDIALWSWEVLQISVAKIPPV